MLAASWETPTVYLAPDISCQVPHVTKCRAATLRPCVQLADVGHTRSVLRSMILVAIVLSGLAIAATTAPARVSTRPTLRQLDAESLVLRGSGFKVHEHVRVVVRTPETHAAKRVIASTRGRFTVRFTTVDPNTCTGFSAVAIGTEGSRAGFKRSPGLCPLP